MVVPLIVYYILFKNSTTSMGGHILGIICSELYLMVVILLLGLDSQEKNIIGDLVKKIWK